MERAQLHRFFSGTATLEEGLEVKVWVEQSAEHEQRFRAERKLFDLLSLHAPAQTGKALPTVWRNAKRRILIQWLKVAAIIVVTLTLHSTWQQYQKSQKPVAMNTISVPAGQRANLVLSDGTQVWLNARTTLHYPASFEGDQRRVLLSGEAYFDVKKEAQRPFVVQTQDYGIEVLGTQFNVEAYPNQSTFETALMRGSVQVFATNHPEESVRIVPNQRVFLQEGKLQVGPVTDLNPYRWKEGLICFQNESFKCIMDDFEKYYGIQIVVTNSEVLKYVYTGKFRQADGIDYALRVLQRDIHFTYEKDNEQQIIHIN